MSKIARYVITSVLLMKPVVNLLKLGLQSYRDTYKIQRYLFERLKTKSYSSSSENDHQKNYLLLVEHKPVYTIGIRSSEYDSNYESELFRTLESDNRIADFHRTERGGLITFHGPGQLVAYPILNLDNFNTSIPNKRIRIYVDRLQETIIGTLKKIGIHNASTDLQYPGVWVDDNKRKIAFVGITCKRHVTMHGISINCNCDLKWFKYIKSCGIVDREITSVAKELDSREKDINIEEESKPENLADKFCESFQTIFNCTFDDTKDNAFKFAKLSQF